MDPRRVGPISASPRHHACRLLHERLIGRPIRGLAGWLLAPGASNQPVKSSGRSERPTSERRQGHPLTALRASIALTLPTKPFLNKPLPKDPKTAPRTCPLRFLPSLTMTTSTSVVPSDCDVNV